jgi:hypothetical protein
MVRCPRKIRSPSRLNLRLRLRLRLRQQDIEKQVTANSSFSLKPGLAKPRPAPNI